ncbi:MAG: CDP-diacylglycerol--serine O-phosphatidyltransferase [Nitrospinae bacterium]|nr:CDP-diacylglycerol--serine O-phosphatidyltransferase [Nitrospinota bacterium]
MKRGIKIIPSLFTTGNCFCGFYAIIAAYNGMPYRAAVAILVAILFDTLDGRVARITKTSTDFGLEYDSLADLISFGVAPALLLYTWSLKPFGRVGWLAVFLFVLCGAIRLARFNVQVAETTTNRFTGLPIPAAAGLVASYVIFVLEVPKAATIKPIIVALGLYVLAGFMVSAIRYRSFKKMTLWRRKPFEVFLAAVLALYILVLIPEVALFVAFLAYAVSGPMEWTFVQIRERREAVGGLTD